VEVKGTFSFNEKDYIKFIFFHYRNQLVLFTLLFILSGIYFIFSIASSNNLNQSESYYYFISCTLILIVFIFLPWWIVYEQSLRNLKKLPHSDFSIEYTFHESGIHLRSEFGTNDFSFKDLRRICETKAFFYIYIQTSKKYISFIQKKHFENLEDIQTFKTLFINNIDKKKLKFKKS